MLNALLKYIAKYVSSESMEKNDRKKRRRKSLAWRAKASLFRGPLSPLPLCGRAAEAVRVATQRVVQTKIIDANVQNANALRIAKTTAVSARPVSQTVDPFCRL